MSAIAKGARVRFTAKNLGLVDHEAALGFEPEMVGVGDEGVYESPHGALEGWHFIEVEVTSEEGENRCLLCPCHHSHFEVIDEGTEPHVDNEGFEVHGS